jgi:hypothetical protein
MSNPRRNAVASTYTPRFQESFDDSWSEWHEDTYWDAIREERKARKRAAALAKKNQAD